MQISTLTFIFYFSIYVITNVKVLPFNLFIYVTPVTTQSIVYLLT